MCEAADASGGLSSKSGASNGAATAAALTRRTDGKNIIIPPVNCNPGWNYAGRIKAQGRAKRVIGGLGLSVLTRVPFNVEFKRWGHEQL